MVCACATRQPDHFYVLITEPQDASVARSTPALQATLTVTVPSVVDRPEMLLNTSPEGIIALEHERWAAPLTDLVTQTLARDLEIRRSDLLIAGQGVNHGAAGVRVAVDLVELTLRTGQRASIETRWRIFDARTGKDFVGGEAFTAPINPGGYADVARGLSDCLALLADRLAGLMPRPD